MDEFDIISRYFAPLSIDGLTDDVGIINPPFGQGRTQIITTDTLVEGVHFLPTDPPNSLGHKLVRVNVSDIWAKGGKPTQALLNLGWPMGRPKTELTEFAQGFAQALEGFDITLLGGDTVNAPCIHLTLTLIGWCSEKGPVKRSGGFAGDDLWVTGDIGAGFIGLRDAKAGDDTAARAHFWCPNLPNHKAVDVVANFANASLDISDGLLQDAAHLARESGVGIEINQDDIPFHHKGALEIEQMTGGDDYQILFTAPAIYAGRLARHTTKIGRVIEGKGITLLKGGEKIDLPEIQGHHHIF